MRYLSLTPLDLAAAALLLFVNGLLSWGFRLGLERSLAVAAMRMVIQLGAAGFVLKFVFERSSPLWTALLAVLMVLAAGHEALARPQLRPGGWQAYCLGAGTLFLVGLLVTLYTTGIVIGSEARFAPRYLLPILGMVLGNALTGVSLVFGTMAETAERQRGAIEARIALGQSRLEALSDVTRTGLRTGL